VQSEYWWCLSPGPKIASTPGDVCNFELYEDERYSCRIVTFCVRVIRTGSNKLALEFVNMDVDNYMFLQSLVLYNTDDPLDAVTEFQDSFPNSSLTAACGLSFFQLLSQL